MEETISTTVEPSEVQITPEVTETSRSAKAPASATQPEEVQTIEEVTTEPDKTEETTTENVEAGDAEVKEAPKDWERIAKDNQASFTRVSQELAELKKQIEAQKPKVVEDGKIKKPSLKKQGFKFYAAGVFPILSSTSFNTSKSSERSISFNSTSGRLT